MVLIFFIFHIDVTLVLGSTQFYKMLFLQNAEDIVEGNACLKKTKNKRENDENTGKWNLTHAQNDCNICV